MKKIRWYLAIFLCLFAGVSSVTLAATTQNLTPVGYWQQYDDRTGQLESILHISNYNGELFATPVKAFPINGRAPDVYCTKCSGQRHNAKIIGMTVMWDMRQVSPTQWARGRIIDPKNGKIYRCKMTLINQGQDLNVRGYIGISLLGRSQVWKRMQS